MYYVWYLKENSKLGNRVYYYSTVYGLRTQPLCSRQWAPWTPLPQGSSKIRRRLDVESWGMKILGFVNLNLFIFGHGESSPNNFWSMVNLERMCDLLFYYFLCLKANLDLEKTNQLGESSPNFIFSVVNLDLIILEKRWIDGESWPDDFVEKVNRGEDLRWVGSRWPLTYALVINENSEEWFFKCQINLSNSLCYIKHEAVNLKKKSIDAHIFNKLHNLLHKNDLKLLKLVIRFI